MKKTILFLVACVIAFAFMAFELNAKSDITAFQTTRITPTIDLSGSSSGYNYSTTYTRGDTVGVAIVDTNMSIESSVESRLQSAVVTLTNYKDTDEILTSGVNAMFAVTNTTSTTEATIVVTLAADTTMANYKTALKALKFINDAADCDTTTREITFTVHNGPSSNTATTSIVVN